MEKVFQGEVQSTRENLKIRVKLRLMWLVFYAAWDSDCQGWDRKTEDGIG